jgi:hypothetical protein
MCCNCYRCFNGFAVLRTLRHYRMNGQRSEWCYDRGILFWIAPEHVLPPAGVFLLGKMPENPDESFDDTPVPPDPGENHENFNS